MRTHTHTGAALGDDRQSRHTVVAKRTNEPWSIRLGALPPLLCFSRSRVTNCPSLPGAGPAGTLKVPFPKNSPHHPTPPPGPGNPEWLGPLCSALRLFCPRGRPAWRAARTPFSLASRGFGQQEVFTCDQRMEKAWGDAIVAPESPSAWFREPLFFSTPQ